MNRSVYDDDDLKRRELNGLDFCPGISCIVLTLRHSTSIIPGIVVLFYLIFTKSFSFRKLVFPNFPFPICSSFSSLCYP